MAQLTGIEETDPAVNLRILDPNPGKSQVLKYKFPYDQITPENIKQFVVDYVNNALFPYSKFETDPKSRSEHVVALNSQNF